MDANRRLVLLGATGTVGMQTLELLGHGGPSAPTVAVLTAHRSRAALQRLAAAHPGARTFLTSDPAQRAALLEWLAAGDYEVCLNAAVGAAGLPYSARVLEAGRTLALANKESLVCAGALLVAEAQRRGGAIVPVDSEHAALQQCLEGRAPEPVRTLFLTASGGALRDLPATALARVTPEQALAHPTWDMGPRITVDSATMMNKAFEILEAVALFGVPPERVRVLLHRESVAHGMVEFEDGSVLAQLGPPDMAFPIHRALHWPAVAPAPLRGFDAALWSSLHFAEPDPARWPALALGYEAARRGGCAGAVLNAADEVAVEAFLAGRVPFPAIVELCRDALAASPDRPLRRLADAEEADAWARAFVAERLAPLRAP
jgi:1-deoxy-D-xylulose-5-phosphate reductoisomerase